MTDPFKDLLESDNPDKEIEHFWLNLKDTLINNIKIETEPIVDKKLLMKWSQELNKLQKEKKYSEIEDKIHQYVIIMAIMHLSNYNHYAYSILMTNIKRWNRVASAKNQINKSTSWSPNPQENKSLWGYLIEVGNLITKKDSQTITNDVLSIFESYQLDLDTTYKEQLMILDEIMIYGLGNRISTLVDMFSQNKLFKMYDFIKEKYGLDVHKGIKSNKLFKIIDSH